MTPLLLDKIRSHYPKSPAFRRMIAKLRVNREKRKLLSPELIAQGEQNDVQKEKIVRTEFPKQKKNYNNTKKAVKKLFKAIPELNNRQDRQRLITDILFCRLAYGFMPDEYWCFHLENQTMEQRKEWVSDIDRYIYVYSLNDLVEDRCFNNKGLTYKRFAKYYKRKALYITSEADRQHFMRFAAEHPVFVKKAVMGSLGRGIELVNLKEDNRSAEALFDEILKEGPHIVEERVIQGEKTAELNASSVNTVRVITLNTKKGISVLYTFMKVGRAGSFVDNGGSGGILVGIDRETGVMNTDGYDELDKCYAEHPDNKTVFRGFQLPEWDKMLSICKEMSASIPDVRMIGWDMAYSNKGWLVIEGNGMSQLIGPQIVWRRGVKKEFSEYLKDVDMLV